MEGSFLAQIDWSRPWLAPYRAIVAPILQAPDWRLALNAAAEERGLHNHRNQPIRFVPQSTLPSGLAYESFISETGCVPTRDNLHDFFNALIWLTYPLTKAKLNELQAETIVKAGTTAVRGRLRDALTLFDENAALFVTCDAQLVESLREHQWEKLFIERRTAFRRQYAVHLFGHALIEKLVMPYKAITAHAWPILMDEGLNEVLPIEQGGGLDQVITSQLSTDLSTRDFMPLPVLGLPGWGEQQNEAFYRDKKVFRAKRSSSCSH